MKVAAVIPAYNEEAHIEPLLKVFLNHSSIDEVIVVDDGSCDNTGRVARNAGAKVIRQDNKGKGSAMMTGVEGTDADIIFFSDADLKGITAEHITTLLDPVLRGEADMTIGLRDRGQFFTWLFARIAPVLSGERVLHRDIFLALKGRAAADFGIETLMNAYCRKERLSVQCFRMGGVRQVIKEKKWGLTFGLISRVKMIGQILRAEWYTLWM